MSPARALMRRLIILQIILPLLSLLLRRHTQLIELACKYPLHDVELYDAEISVNTLAESICNRLSTLICKCSYRLGFTLLMSVRSAHFQHQNLNIRQEFTHAYNGMVSRPRYLWRSSDPTSVFRSVCLVQKRRCRRLRVSRHGRKRLPGGQAGHQHSQLWRELFRRPRGLLQ